MYTELVNQYAGHIQFAQPQPTAGSQEIEKAERSLGVAFPEELKNLLLEMDGDEFLLWSLGYLVSENLRIHDGPYASEKAEQYLFFATNGCGDHYGYPVVNGNVRTDEIVMFEHELGKAKTVAADIGELIRLYYTDQI